MKHLYSRAVLAALLVMPLQAALAGDDPKVAAEVIAVTRAAWAAEAQGKSIAEQNAVLADDYTDSTRTIRCESTAGGERGVVRRRHVRAASRSPAT